MALIPRYGMTPGGANTPMGVATRGAPFPRPRRVIIRPRPIAPRPTGAWGPRPAAAAPAAPGVDPLWTQANDTVMKFMNPMLARLAAQRVAAEANARTAATTHGDALSSALVQSAKPMDESFNRGIVASSAVNDALANRLNAVGGQEQGALTAQLAQIGAADSGEVANLYKNASNAGFATGSADLQNLISQRAAGGAYQAKLPGIGRLEGSRDLQQALSEMRGNFGEQERSLQDMAAEKSFDLWGTLRGEKRTDTKEKAAQARADAQFKAGQIARAKELHSKNMLALQALNQGTLTKQQQLEYKRQADALNRQLKLDIANINAATRLATDNPPAPVKPTSMVGQPNMPFIPGPDGQPVQNPNWHGTWNGLTPVAPKPKPKDVPGGTPAQRRLRNNQAATNVRRLLLNPMTGKVKAWVDALPNDELVATINGAIEQALIPANSPDGIAQRKAIFKILGIPTGPKGNPYYPKKKNPPPPAGGV